VYNNLPLPFEKFDDKDENEKRENILIFINDRHLAKYAATSASAQATFRHFGGWVKGTATKATKTNGQNSPLAMFPFHVACRRLPTLNYHSINLSFNVEHLFRHLFRF
jgi:hypothetical protein